MSSITIDPTDFCIQLNCGVGEADVSFTAADMYAVWKAWAITGDNSKYLPAFDSAGGNPVGLESLDNVYFLQLSLIHI